MKINSLYTLQGSTVTDATIVSTSASILDTPKLWHMRLRHISEKWLTILRKKRFAWWIENMRTRFL